MKVKKLKKFSIICDNKTEFLECQKLLFKIGYVWNMLNNKENETLVTDWCNEDQYPAAILVNFRNSNENSFIYDENYTKNKYESFYIENNLFKYKQFSRKYKLQKLNKINNDLPLM